MLLRGVRGVPWCPDPQVGTEVEVAVAPAPLCVKWIPPDPGCQDVKLYKLERHREDTLNRAE